MGKKVERIIDYLEKRRILSKEYELLYRYGFELWCEKVISIICIVIIGIWFQKIIESIIFLCLYSCLRKRAGGYHAKTKRNCRFITCLFTFMYIVLISSCRFSFQITLMILIGESIIVLLLAPVDNINKPLEEKKIPDIKKHLKIVLGCLIVGYFFWGKTRCFIYSVPSTLLIQIISLVLGIKHSPIYNKSTKEKVIV